MGMLQATQSGSGWTVTPGQPVGGGGGVGGLGVVLNRDMSRWRRRFARGVTGGILTRITVFGDSNIGGTGAGSYYNEAGALQNTGTFGVLGGYPFSISQAVGGFLRTRFNAVMGESIFGDQGLNQPATPVNYADVDPRVTFGAGWSNANDKSGTGGSWFTATGATGGRFRFLPATPWDVANVFCVRFSGGSTDARIYANNVLKSTLNLSGGNALPKTTITADSLAAQALEVENFGAGVCLVVGAEVYDSKRPGLMIRQVGQAGGTIDGIIAASAPWQTGGWHAANPGAMSVIYSTINDVLLLTPAQYATKLTTWANRCIANGEDMLWVGCFPANDPHTSDGRLDALKAAAAGVLDPLGVNMIDLRGYMGSTWAQANASGYMFDDRHPNRTGHALIGQIIAEAIGG